MTTEKEKCGMGRTYFPCIRPKGHDSPVSVCFAVSFQGNGAYLYQDSVEWCKDSSEWPEDAILNVGPWNEPAHPSNRRRAAIEATKAKHAKE